MTGHAAITSARPALSSTPTACPSPKARGRRQELSFRAVVSDAMSCDHEGQGHVQVLMDDGLVMPRLNSHTLWIAGWKTGC